MILIKQILRLTFGLFLTFNAFGQIPTNGLVAYYPFNGNLLDASGNNNHGNATATGVQFGTDRNGNIGQTLSLSGSNYVIIPKNSLLDLANSISISFWINSNDNDGRIFDKTSVGQSDGYNIDVFNNTFRFIGGLPNFTTIVQPGGVWKQITFTYDGVTKKLYTNGVLTQTVSTTTTITSSIHDIHIGVNTNKNGNFLIGQMDDVRLYSRELTPSEISALYTEGCVTYFAQAPTLTFDGTSMLTQTYAGANYAWSLNGSSISGANSNVFSGTISAGTYNVTITNAACKSVASYVQANDVVNTANGLVAYYPFNGNANDESGNGNNGTAINGATLLNNRFQNVNSAFTFNGINGAITVPGSGLNFIQNLSISFWVSPNSIQTMHAGILDKSHSTPIGANWVVEMNSTPNSNLYYFAQNTNGGTSGFFLPPNKWSYVTITKNNTILKAYLNNILLGTFTAFTDISDNKPLIIGAENSSSNGVSLFRFFNGIIDDIRIYSRAINPSEVNALYTEGCSTYFAQTPTLTFNGTNMLTQTYAGANYAWSLNGSSISGANSNVFSGTISAGTYNVTITNAACKSVASYVQANDVVNIANGLVAYYPFNGNANDESGNGWNGTIVGSGILPSLDRFSLSGKSYTFTGLGSYINTSFLGIEGNKSRTISMWTKLDRTNYSFGLSYGKLGGDLGTSFRCGFNFNSNGNVSIDGGDVALGYGNINDNKWHFVTWVVPENTINFTSIKIYIDGNQIINPVQTYNTSRLVNTTLQQPITIGIFDVNFINSSMKGLLDDIRIYNRALNQSEISALWNNCIGTDINTMNLPISGSNSVCLGIVNSYSIATTTGISYNWSVSGGNTFTVKGNNLNVTANNIGVYTITAMPTYACGNGTVTSSFVVSVSGSAPTPTITGNLMPKSCVSENYEANVASGLGSYTWATSENHVLPTNSTVGITFTSTGIKQISVTRIDAQCNFSTTSSINVTVSAPNLENPIVTRTANLSNLQSTNVTTSGVSFQWVKDNLDEAGETSSTHNNQLENATYKLRADFGLCATAISNPYHVFVVTFIPAAVTVVSPPVTITSPPVTVTSVLTVSSPPVTITSIINDCSVTGTNNAKKIQSSFSVYPNPSNGEFTIESEGMEITLIKVYAADGRLVYGGKNESKLDLTNMPSGIYKLLLYDKNGDLLGTTTIFKN